MSTYIYYWMDDSENEFSQPEDVILEAAGKKESDCRAHHEICGSIQRALSTSGGSLHPGVKQLRKNRIMAVSKAQPEVEDPDEIELHMMKEESLPFTEFRVRSILLYGALKANDLCYFRAEPSRWQNMEEHVDQQRLFQFGVYGEMSLASLLSLAFKVVNIVGVALSGSISPGNYREGFKSLFDAARMYDGMINAGNQLVRDTILTHDVKLMIETIGEILIKLEEYYHDEQSTSEDKLLYLDCHDLIVNVLLTKPTLDGEQAAQLYLLIESQLKFLCYTTADKSAAFSVYYTIPVWSEYTIDRSSTSSKTQFILESKMVYRFLHLNILTQTKFDAITQTEGFNRAAAILRITPDEYATIIRSLKRNVGIPIDAESKSWSSRDTESERFNRRMERDVERQSVYGWLCDDTMDLWLNGHVLIKNRYVFFVSRMMFNYHCLDRNLQESKVRDPNCKSASIFDHDYEGLSHRFYLGAPILFHRMLNDFAYSYGIDMTSFIGRINFEEELLVILKENEISTDDFFQEFIDSIKSDPFIIANLTEETKGKMRVSTGIDESFAQLPVDVSQKMTRKRTAPPIITLRHPEFKKYLEVHPECAQIFDEVGDALMNMHAHKFEEQWRWYSCNQRCIMVQSSFIQDKEACIYVSRDINLLERMQDPLQGTVDQTYDFISVIETPKTPGGVGGPVDLSLSTDGTNLSVFSVVLNTVVTCVDSAHQKKGYFTSEVFSGLGQSLSYGGCDCAYVHPFLKKPTEVVLVGDYVFAFDFTKRFLMLIQKKPSCITAATVPSTIHMFTDWSDKHHFTLYGVISKEIEKISTVYPELGQGLTGFYDGFYEKMIGIKEQNTQAGKKGKNAVELWKDISEPLQILIRNMDGACLRTEYAHQPIVANSVYSIFKYLELVLFQGEKEFNTVRLIMKGRHFPHMDSHRPGEGVMCPSAASPRESDLAGAIKGPSRAASSQRPSDTKSKDPLGGATRGLPRAPPRGPPRGPAKGGGWDDWLGNANKKVLGYSFADVGNDLVLKPIYSEEEYKKLKHRQYINILLNIRQQQIENRIKQEQQTILNKQKPMISAIRNSLGFKPLRPVISYPQSHQPDLSKQKTMFSAVGNTIKRINPFKTPVHYQTEGGKFTKKIKKTKQTRKYKPLSNKRTSYKLYR